MESKLVYIVLLSLVTLFSCGEDGKKAKADKEETKLEPPAMTEAEIAGMVSKIQGIDLTFLVQDFSANTQGADAAVRIGSLIHPSAPSAISDACKENILISAYDTKREVIGFFRIYFGEGCNYLDMYNNPNETSPLYRNRLTQNGVNFFSQIIAQAESERPG